MLNCALICLLFFSPHLRHNITLYHTLLPIYLLFSLDIICSTPIYLLHLHLCRHHQVNLHLCLHHQSGGGRCGRLSQLLSLIRSGLKGDSLLALTIIIIINIMTIFNTGIIIICTIIYIIIIVTTDIIILCTIQFPTPSMLSLTPSVPTASVCRCLYTWYLVLGAWHLVRTWTSSSAGCLL